MSLYLLRIKISFDVICKWQWLVEFEQLDWDKCLAFLWKGVGYNRRRLMSVGRNERGSHSMILFIRVTVGRLAASKKTNVDDGRYGT